MIDANHRKTRPASLHDVVVDQCTLISYGGNERSRSKRWGLKMNTDDMPRTVLLILPSRKHIFPLSTAAFSMTQGIKQEIVQDYKDSLILDERGIVWKFDRIEFVGVHGKSAMQKLTSFLTNAKTLAVSLSPRAFALNELKALIADCMLNGQDFVHENADAVERYKVAQAVESATDALALFRLFKMPAPPDSLDQL